MYYLKHVLHSQHVPTQACSKVLDVLHDLHDPMTNVTMAMNGAYSMFTFLVLLKAKHEHIYLI